MALPAAHSAGSKQQRITAPSAGSKLTWASRVQEGTAKQRRRRAADIRRLQNHLQSYSIVHDDEAGPSPRSMTQEVLWEQRLHATLRREKQARQQDLTRLDVVSSKLLALSAHLDADVSVLARITAAEGQLLLLQPQEFKARVQAVAQGLDMEFHQALALAARDPPLLTRPASTLQASLASMVALFKSRGMPPLTTLAAQRPDLLRSNPSTLAVKLDSLSMALGGVSYKVVRSLVSAAPSLLRRSSNAVNARHETLVKLLEGLPRSYVAEILMSAPALLEVSPAMLQAKFNTLYNKYGAFRDDVVDVVLVDPQALLKAPPTWRTAKIKSSRSSRSGSSSSSQSPSASPPSTASVPSTRPAASTSLVTGTGPGSRGVSGTPQEAHAALSSGDESDGSDAQEEASTSSSSSSKDKTGSAVHTLRRWASVVGVPLYSVLQMYSGSAPEGVQGSPRGQPQSRNALVRPGKWLGDPVVLKSLPGRLNALTSALGVSREDARRMAGRAPLILTISTSDLKKRLAALAALAASKDGDGRAASSSPVPASRTNQAQAAGVAVTKGHQIKVSRRPANEALMQMLVRQPELLLQSEAEVQARVEVLQARLGLRNRQLMKLLMQKPRALLLSPQQLDKQLQDISNILGGISASVMGELVAREPGLLEAPTQQVADRFAEISSSFGSFISDALGVVLADPSILLRQQQVGGRAAGTLSSRWGKASGRAGAAQGQMGGSGQAGGGRVGGSVGRASGPQAPSSAQLVAADALDAMLQAEEKARQENQERNAQKRRQRKQQQQQEQGQQGPSSS